MSYAKTIKVNIFVNVFGVPEYLNASNKAHCSHGGWSGSPEPIEKSLHAWDDVRLWEAKLWLGKIWWEGRLGRSTFESIAIFPLVPRTKIVYEPKAGKPSQSRPGIYRGSGDHPRIYYGEPVVMFFLGGQTRAALFGSKNLDHWIPLESLYPTQLSA